jgi:hypothetical protein
VIFTSNTYSTKQHWKFVLLIVAFAIGIGSLWYTNRLVNELSAEEHKKVELWAEATRRLSESIQQNIDIEFILKVVENNSTVPVILTDSSGNIISYRNFRSLDADSPGYLEKELALMKGMHPPIVVDLGDRNYNFIYYKESLILQKLTIYPYIQLSVIIVFLILSYIAFSAARRAEQNKVWLGLSRETAHQLGTPTSSLMAWTEILRDKLEQPELIDELEKDIHRLNVITERFSKIGSQPILQPVDILQLVNGVGDYMRKRMSASIHLSVNSDCPDLKVPLNANLFEWVFENLIKNALDAISSPGSITVQIQKQEKVVWIDVTDTGKGIPKRHFKRIFRPGYTTKSRGWGLGLSLTRRIVSEYHHGKIFVLWSEPGKGTTFRISLPLLVKK